VTTGIKTAGISRSSIIENLLAWNSVRICTMTKAFRKGYLSVLNGAWTVVPAEKRLAASALRQERVSVRYAFGVTTDRMARAYESEKRQASSNKA
jgi:hypothetical protein